MKLIMVMHIIVSNWKENISTSVLDFFRNTNVHNVIIVLDHVHNVHTVTSGIVLFWEFGYCSSRDVYVGLELVFVVGRTARGGRLLP